MGRVAARGVAYAVSRAYPNSTLTNTLARRRQVFPAANRSSPLRIVGETLGERCPSSSFCGIHGNSRSRIASNENYHRWGGVMRLLSVVMALVLLASVGVMAQESSVVQVSGGIFF